MMRNITILLLFISLSSYGVTLEHLIQEALIHSPIIKEKKIKKEIYREKEKQIRSSIYGKFYLYGGYEHLSEKTNLGFLDPSKGIAGMTFANNFYSLGIGYSVPIFTGFRISSELKIAEKELYSADTEERLTKNELIYKIKKIYLNILLLNKQEKSLKAYIDSLKKLKENIAVSVKAGKKAEVDILKVEYQLQDAYTKFEKIKSDIDNLKYEIRYLIGRQDLELKNFEDIKNKTQIPEIKEIENLLYLKKVQIEKEKTKEFIKKQKSLFYPQLDLDLIYSKRYASGESFDYYRIGLNIKYTLFDFGKRASAVLEGKKNYRLLKEKEKSIVLNLKKEINKALSDIKISEERIKSAEKQIKFSKEIERIEKIKYESGVSDIFDLLKAKADRIAAETKYYEAFYKREIAVAYLNFLISEE